MKRIAWVFLACLLLAGAFHAYHHHVQHALGTVSPGALYRSGAMPPEKMAQVAKSLGLKTVVDFRTTVEGEDSTNTTSVDKIRAEAAALEQVGVRHVHLPTPQVPSAETVRQFLALMENPANRPALIHCHHGVGRTELFAALYRIEFENWSNEKARSATRLFVPFSSFSDKAEKGQYLLHYEKMRKAPAPAPVKDALK